MTSSAGARRFNDTPARLSFQRNLLAALIVAWAVLTIGVLGVLRTQAKRVERAAGQVSTVQQTKVQLTKADSLATSGYLTGGLQSDQALASFATDMAAANTGLARLSRGVGGGKTDQTLTLINSYLADVTAAQANNRQGWPVGATYQKTASKSLSEQILPSLDSVDRAARDSLVTSGRALGWSWAITPLFAALVAIPVLLALALLSVRTNRLVNVPMLVALAITAVAYLFAASVAGTSKSETVTGIRTVFRDNDLTGQARVALYNAKSAEALTLIARGSGQAYELQWRANMSNLGAAIDATPRLKLDPQVTGALAAYQAEHEAVRAADDAGDWDAARAKVLARPGSTSSATFQALDDAIREARTGSVVGPHVGRDLTLAQFFIGLAALIGAALVRAGIGQRLKEYQ